MAIRGVLFALMLILWPAGPAIAADLPAQPAPPAPAAPMAASPLAAPDAACLEWSDGCRTCQRPAGGEPACSNIGIACVPRASVCVRR
jgi:hypothetical protein